MTDKASKGRRTGRPRTGKTSHCYTLTPEQRQRLVEMAEHEARTLSAQLGVCIDRCYDRWRTDK